MNQLELEVHNWLRSAGFSDVQYEPKGNAFPDFILESRILVECTQLRTTKVAVDGSIIDVTAQTRPLLDTLQNTIENFELTDWRVSTFVNIRFKRLCTQAELRSAIRVLLRKQSGQSVSRQELSAANCILTVNFQTGARDFGTPFQVGATSPPHGAGWVVPDLLTKVADAFGRKQERLENSSLTMQENWLVVSGNVTVGIGNDSFQKFCELFTVPTPWTRLVLFNRIRPSCSRILKA